MPSSASTSSAKKPTSETDSSKPKPKFFALVPPPTTTPPPSLQAAMPPEAPKPPSILALELAPATPLQPASGRGLFESLVADPRVLFHGLLESPESYESGVSELLQNLVSGRKKREELTPEESLLLDRATVEFAAGKRPKQDGGAAPQSRAARTPKSMTPPEEAELIYSARGPHIPAAVADAPVKAPSLWWKK